MCMYVGRDSILAIRLKSREWIFIFAPLRNNGFSGKCVDLDEMF